MKANYILVLIFCGALFFLNNAYQKQYVGLHTLFQVADNLQDKEVFTESYKPQAIASWSKLDPNKDWLKATNEDYLKILAACLNEYASYNVDRHYYGDTLNYHVYFATRKPFAIDFELVPSENGIQINNIANIEALFGRAKEATLYPKEDQVCVQEKY